MKKTLLSGIAVLFLATGTADAYECAFASPPVDKDGACELGGPKVPVEHCKEYGHPLYYREKGAPGLLHLRKEPNKKSEWITKLDAGTLLWLGSAEREGWRYVWAIGERQLFGSSNEGWVSTKFITKIDCPEKQEAKDDNSAPEAPVDDLSNALPYGTPPNCYPKWTGIKRC